MNIGSPAAVVVYSVFNSVPLTTTVALTDAGVGVAASSKTTMSYFLLFDRTLRGSTTSPVERRRTRACVIVKDCEATLPSRCTVPL